ACVDRAAADQRDAVAVAGARSPGRSDGATASGLCRPVALAAAQRDDPGAGRHETGARGAGGVGDAGRGFARRHRSPRRPDAALQLAARKRYEGASMVRTVVIASAALLLTAPSASSQGPNTVPAFGVDAHA